MASDVLDSTEANADDAESLYRTMMTIRSFELKVAALFAAAKLPGFVHLSLGQEAIAAGVCSILNTTDLITTTHRGHGHCIAKGGEVPGMMAELYGRAEGYCKGRSGSMHIMEPAVGILGANAIVGAGIPMAAGAALSAQMSGDGRVAVAFFGEGAVGEGIFHEVLNLASLWSLPVVFVVENNQYAEHSHVSKHLAAKHVVDYAAAYQMPAENIDGNDVLAVRAAATRAVDRARNGDGPTLLEFETYRWHGHFEGDPGKYRSSDELDAWKLRDPLTAFREYVLNAGLIESDRLDSLDAEIDASVEAASEWAEALQPAPESSLLEDVYTMVRN